MHNRRFKERRAFNYTTQFPLILGNGRLIRADRRKPQDRRLSNAKLKWQHALPKVEAKRLLLIYHDAIRELNGNSSSLIVGRSHECDLLIPDRYVSSIHARFEYINGEFVLMDLSLNGTFVQSDKEGNFHILGDKIYLWGSGLISFGRPIKSNGEDLIRYFCQ